MIVILDCGSSKTRYIEDAVDEFCDFKTISILDFSEDDLVDAQAVIISGAPILITEQSIDHFLDKITWIKETKIPVLGICFGHQLIGILFGSFGSKMREDRDWQTIEFYEDSLLFDKIPSEFEMMEDHCEAISVPPGFKLIASSDACVNESMQHLTLPIYGVQFHPEVSGNLGRVLLENFYKLSENLKSTKTLPTDI